MTEGKIVSWIKSEGDVLSKGESVVVVESDKADMDVETFYDGILAAIVVAEGETAPVGAPIGLLAETEDEITEAKGMAAKSAYDAADSAPEALNPAPDPAPATSSPPTKDVPDATPSRNVVTPYAKKLAKQHKVEIGSVVGTGPYGRITAADVEKAAGITPSASNVALPVVASAPPKATAAAPAATLAPIPGSSVVSFTTMQSAVAKNMVDSLSVPTFRVGYPITTDALDALYEKVCLCC
jgi:pyruvate dehydrogenase E2 component (dihydrolipoamide acetyltransferase)